MSSRVWLKAKLLGKKAEWWFLRAEAREGVFYLRIQWEFGDDRDVLYPDGDNGHRTVDSHTKKSN